MISPTDLLHPSPAHHISKLSGVSDLLPEATDILWVKEIGLHEQVH
jgi:hypothetical protein